MENVVDVKSKDGMFVYHKSQGSMVNLDKVTHIYRGTRDNYYYIRFFIGQSLSTYIEWSFTESSGGEEERNRVLKKIQMLYGESL